MTGSRCMGCGAERNIPAYAAITPCGVCGSTGITMCVALSTWAQPQPLTMPPPAGMVTFSSGFTPPSTEPRPPR